MEKETENEIPKQFTNRELWMLIDKNYSTNKLEHQALTDSITEFYRTTKMALEEIVKQTKKTNGNVMDLLLWKMYVKGQTFLVPIILTTIISLVLGLLFNHAFVR